MKAKVYIETTVISYLAARPSRDLIVAAHQQMTHEWWEDQRAKFDLLTSQFVIDEASAGDQKVAAKRLELLTGVPLAAINDDARELAKRIVERKALSGKAAEDALHISVATVHEMDYLLTWNCKHIANAGLQKPIGRICAEMNFSLPTICTPEELSGE